LLFEIHNSAAYALTHPNNKVNCLFNHNPLTQILIEYDSWSSPHTHELRTGIVNYIYLLHKTNLKRLPGHT
jgi:hypothetical protein